MSIECGHGLPHWWPDRSTEPELGSNPAERWLSRADIARQFRLHPASVARFVQSGRLPPPIVRGGRCYWPESWVEPYLRQRLHRIGAET
jgi:hypothetical protein